jgi:hypothetical protein
MAPFLLVQLGSVTNSNELSVGSQLRASHGVLLGGGVSVPGIPNTSQNSAKYNTNVQDNPSATRTASSVWSDA